MKWNTRIDEMALQEVPFASDSLEYLDTRKIETFGDQIESVDLRKVLGTKHPDYGDKTWGDLKPIKGTLSAGARSNSEILFQPLKRALTNCDWLAANPSYYLDQTKKEHWGFFRIGDDYFIEVGNNRTIIARYFFHLNDLPPIVHGVSVTQAVYKNEEKGHPFEGERQPQRSLYSSLMEFFKT